jgi:hypothetical protein
MATISDFPLQAALEVMAPSLRNPDAGQRLIAAKCLGLMLGYDHRWRNAPYQIMDVECVLTSDLYNPETGRKSRSFILGGKLDVRALEKATLAKVLFDHKTCSQDIADPNAPYWRQLVIEGQVDHYMSLEWLNGNKVDAAVWDVLRKPGISPRILSKADAKEVLATGKYFDYELDKDDKDMFAEESRETAPMYAARLARDSSEERPEWYFQRRQVPRLDAEVRDYMQEVWGHGQDILVARSNNRWPRNSGACMLYGTPCKFLNVCSGYDTIDSPNWSTKAWVHPELPVLPDCDRGTDILTNSRIRCFQTCRKKHYFTYELGVEKLDEEEREALFFGNLFHAGLEQYFLQLKDLQGKGQL